jgi:hypothetical protein
MIDILPSPPSGIVTRAHACPKTGRFVIPNHLAFGVVYEREILTARTGRVVRRSKAKRNMVTDYGLNQVASVDFTALFSHCVIGTGLQTVKRDSGAVTFTQVNNTVSSSAGFFEAADVGRLFKRDSGEEVYITAFTNSQTVTVGGPSVTLGAAEGTVWYVNTAILQTESKRIATYSTATNECGYSIDGDTFTLWRSFLFAAETGTVTYREIGWSHTASTGANLVGRDLIPNGGDTLVSGQQYKVKVSFIWKAAPMVPTEIGTPVDGWASTASHCIESPTPCGSINSNGGGGNGFLSPAINQNVGLTTFAGALVAPTSIDGNGTNIGGYVSNTVKATTQLGYVAGTYFRDRQVAFETTEYNSGGIRGFGFFRYAGNYYSNYRVLLGSAVTKANTHRLTLTFRTSWSRVLVN